MGRSARSVQPTAGFQSWAGNALRGPTGQREGFVNLDATLARNAPLGGLARNRRVAGTLPGPRPFPHSAALGPTPGPTSFLILSWGHSLSPAQPGALPPCTLGSPVYRFVLKYPGCVHYTRLLCPLGTWESLWARVFEASQAWQRRLGVPRDTSGALIRGLVSPSPHGRPGTGLPRCARRFLGDYRTPVRLRTSQGAGLASTRVGRIILSGAPGSVSCVSWDQALQHASPSVQYEKSPPMSKSQAPGRVQPGPRRQPGHEWEVAAPGGRLTATLDLLQLPQALALWIRIRNL